MPEAVSEPRVRSHATSSVLNSVSITTSQKVIGHLSATKLSTNGLSVASVISPIGIIRSSTYSLTCFFILTCTK